MNVSLFLSIIFFFPFRPNLYQKIESTDVNLETERDKALHFTKLKTYSDFKRLPKE